MRRWCGVGLAAVVGLAGCAVRPPAPPLEHGVLAAEAGSGAVTLWTRAPGPGPVRFELDEGMQQIVQTTAARDFTAQVRFSGLEADRQYSYVITHPTDGRSTTGRFRTAPAGHIRASVRFAFGGDVAGQNVCRDVQLGMPVFGAIAKRRPHFLIGLGDMIYADDPCEPVGWYGNEQVPGDVARATTLPEFHQRWAYVRADRHWRELLAGVGYYGVWDDHEALNDFGPDSAGELLGPARQAFLDYTPVNTAPERLYRQVRWGRHLEMFILDTRSYRSPNAMPDGPAKSLLGTAQRDWLIDAVRGSEATWKIVVSSVPIAIPTGWPPEGPRDGWASGDGPGGYEHELQSILQAWAQAGVGKLVWLTTDVHHATGFRYQPFAERPEFELHEFVSGPLNAGIFPSQALDLTFNPTRLYYHAPASVDAVGNHASALTWFNFGLVEIDANGRLDLRIVDANGREVARQVLF